MFQESPSKDNSELAIIKTIAFFDLFDYPLTAYEIFENLEGRANLAEVMAVLDGCQRGSEGMNGRKIIQGKSGFYFLTGRSATVETRQQRYNYARNKMKIASRFARLFSFCPFVQAVAAANLIGSHNLRAESDIDFFIITAPRRIWLARLYCAGLAALLRVRPTAGNKRDKVCLSFYISADHLNIDDLRLAGSDPYFDHWRRGLVLLYNKGEIYSQFLIANGLREGEVVLSAYPENSWRDSFEDLAKRWQLKIMSPALKTAMNNSDGVVISDQVLKLYWSDRRREYAKKYEQKISEALAAGN